ncbi:hypothetical protein [Geomicrobium sp. JCM 19038]|uniref:hypothetical protein n=1 Tax=Geomicrobium sp. JCM 19038 TaxID=1460635 RepID=UPI00045F1B80|nr:hypothetical protein [Geomicrobium sp. JCM 19038]GAK08889.1 hypothetical protein JCM19038_2689 [Geomicrobium sp. JCM 19038]
MKKFGMAALTAVVATGLVACGDTTDDEGQDTVEVPAEEEIDTDDLETDEDDTDMMMTQQKTQIHKKLLLKTGLKSLASSNLN